MSNSFPPWPDMSGISGLTAFLEPALMGRLTLLANHVLMSEPVATQKLLAHAGKRFSIHWDGWPALLPPAPRLVYLITPAGLLEWQGAGADAGASPVDLDLHIDASNPAWNLMQAMTGSKPHVNISGDAALAADLQWMMEHLRWDIRDDLSRLMGQAPAEWLSQWSRSFADGLGQALAALRSTWGGRPGSGT